MKIPKLPPGAFKNKQYHPGLKAWLRGLYERYNPDTYFSGRWSIPVTPVTHVEFK